MESLQATYRDDEEDEEEEEQEQEEEEQQEDDSELITVPINQTPISMNYFQSNTNNSDELSEELSEEDLPQQISPLKKHKSIPQISKKSSSSKKKPKSRKGNNKKKNNSSNPNHHSNAHQVFDEMSVQISPIPKLHLLPDKSSDDSPDLRICLSKLHKAEKVELSEDRLTAGSSKGYRMVRATRGVVKGAWYFEIKVMKLGETGHSRVGWSTEKGDLQAPVGYDGSSFGFRDIDGSKIHKATREVYGDEGYVEGDVIGHYINLPDGDLYAPKEPNWVMYKGQKYAAPANGKDDQDKVVPGSEILFFKNGVCQGVAFKDINGGCYYPAASMYTLPNQPNCQVKFNFGPDFDFFPNDFGDRPLPTPMFEVPYQVFDDIIDNTESTEEKIQQSS